MEFLNVLFAAAEGSQDAAAGQQGGSPWASLIFMVAMMVGLILLMIVPQRKRDKQVRAMLNSIKVGDRVRTIGGIYGTVIVAKEDLITIVSGPDDVKLVFARGAIANIEKDEETEAEEIETEGNGEE